jgi:hypothetical protein
MKIINLEISNLKKIKAAFFQFSTTGRVTSIVGGNQQAKSTVLDAIMIALFGPKYMETGATTKGEEKTTITCELDNGYVIKRVFTEKTDRIELNRIIDGKAYPESSPQSFLDGITNVIAIRPIAFINKPASEKSKIISSCLGIDEELDEFKNKIKTFEESRAFIGRIIKEKGKLADYEEGLESKSIKEIQDRMDVAMEKNRTIQQAIENEWYDWEKARKEYDAKQQSKPLIKEAVESLKEKISIIKERFNGNVSEADTLLSTLISEIDTHLSVHKGAYLETDYMVKTPEPLNETLLDDLKSYKKEMEDVGNHNARVQSNNALKLAHAELAEKQKQYNDTVEYIAGLKNTRAAIISTAAKKIGFPFEVDIVNDDIIMDGIESANWSTSQGLLFAMEACKLLNPKLKTICIDNGESFDSESRNLIEEWSEKNDIQTILTVVSRQYENDTDTYYIEEGEIKNFPVITDAMETQIPVKEEKVKAPKKAKGIVEIPIEQPVQETIADLKQYPVSNSEAFNAPVQDEDEW